MKAWQWIGVATVVPLLALGVFAPAAASPTTGEIEQLKSFVEQNPNSVREQYKLGALSVTGVVTDNVDLYGAPIGFGEGETEHSGSFRSDLMARRVYWATLIHKMGLPLTR